MLKVDNAKIVLGDNKKLDVKSFEIKKVDYVRDIVDLSVIYELPRHEKPNYADNVGFEADEDRMVNPTAIRSEG